MTQTVPTISIQTAMQRIEQAQQEGKLTSGAVENLSHWLNEDRYITYRGDILLHVEAGQWQKLDDVFWTVIPFGTGGRRGRMYDFGSNAINDRTIGESAQGLATYVLEQQRESATELSCAIAYDTRHRSRRFAELCAGIMVANGFKVYFLDDFRATPQLSFAVRYKNCNCGIMVTASHNPPSDNAVKVYWSTGGQVLPPHDKAIIDRVMSTDSMKSFRSPTRWPMVESRFARRKSIGSSHRSVAAFTFPVHVTQRFFSHRCMASVPPRCCRFWRRSASPMSEVFQPHAQPSGDFPNVPGHVSNPRTSKSLTLPSNKHDSNRSIL
ncbi:MAG: hypothetical protein R3C05_15115 [Pirellulaceae bacterium]